jgi:hypothetical protein
MDTMITTIVDDYYFRISLPSMRDQQEMNKDGFSPNDLGIVLTVPTETGIFLLCYWGRLIGTRPVLHASHAVTHTFPHFRIKAQVGYGIY